MDQFENLVSQAEQAGWKGEIFDDILYSLQVQYNLISWRMSGYESIDRRLWDDDVLPRCREAHARALNEREDILSGKLSLIIDKEYDEALDPPAFCDYCGRELSTHITCWRIGDRFVSTSQENPCPCLKEISDEEEAEAELRGFPPLRKPVRIDPLREL